MSQDRPATFKLMGKYPKDLPMERLAQYLRVFSQLAGGDVRLDSIGKGSVKFGLAVKAETYSHFVYRVTGARNPKLADPGAARAVDQLEAMITEDQVTAEVKAGTTKLLQLKGYRTEVCPVMGPFTQPYTVRGRLIGLEGKDRTKHARIAEYGADREIPGEIVDIDLARRLLEHMWKGAIEFSGTARLMRHSDGTWEIKAFRVDAFRELAEDRPSDVVGLLRQAMPAAKPGEDVVDFALKHRDD